MFALEDLKIVVEECLILLKLGVGAGLTLCEKGSVDQVVKSQFLDLRLVDCLVLEGGLPDDVVKCILSGEAEPDHHFVFVKHQ